MDVWAPQHSTPLIINRQKSEYISFPNSSGSSLVTHLLTHRRTHKLLKDIDPISGRKTINHYEIFQKLGSGQHGTVKQGRDLQSGGMVAIKIVRRFSKKLRLGRSGDPNDMIKKEVAILKKARHPHVVSLIEVIDDDEFGKVYLVLEYVERGEIIWRKQTDKDVAAFEMARIQREIANNVNEDYERATVTSFNSKAPARRLEKARVLEKQKREAKERFGAQSYRSFGQPRSHLWSLGFESDIENETVFETRSQAEPEPGSRLQLTDETLTANTMMTSTQSESPSHTPLPHPFPLESGSAPTSVPSSRPDTPAIHDGTFLEAKYSNDALQSTLDEIIAGQTQWTPDEEDFRYVPCLTLSQALDAFRDTVLGLEYLHYQGIIHRDIKPANLLWTTDYRVKISDFGVSYLGKPIREDDNNEEIEEADAAILDEAIELAKTVGTPAFYAPELCDPQYFEVGKHPDRPAITGQIDVWALGVTLYGMIFGRLPFWHANEFQMYERIAREEVFIPRMRLRGVSHTDKTPSNHDKRLEDVLEYEEVDDELRDLLKRLLNKQPPKRITLREVKHHPWVLRGISDQLSWMDETDPSLQSQGRKIEVSTQEVQDAVVGLNFVDRVKAGFQRVGSVLRGRGSRKRTESNPKPLETRPPETNTVDPAVPRGVKSPNSRLEKVYLNNERDGRRSSLRGDEQICTALKASRENLEHPLAQSVAASPEVEAKDAYFDQEKRPRPVSDPQAIRPVFPDRNLSTADSMKTIRATTNAAFVEEVPGILSSDELSTATAIPDSIASSTSSLGGIFGGAGRRFVNSMRSRERGVECRSPSQSSRSSSADRDREGPHASPSLAISSIIAAGHVDQPPALREEPELSQPRLNEGSVEAYQRANYRRQTLEYQRHSRRPTLSMAMDVACPPSPDDDIFFAQQRPASAADSTVGFQISSSSDQIMSGESTAHSRIPSVVSGASSLSATVEAEERHPLPPLTIGRRSGSHPRDQKYHESPNPALASAAAEEEAGYNGDSDSDDEGLTIG
jgi:serine/threonine protein kinase